MAKVVIDDRDNFDIISEELAKYGGPQKATGTSRYICCPLPEHGGENTPSCGVYMQVDAAIPLGYFHCFGCSGKGPWNKLAEIAGMAKIAEWKKASEVSATMLTRDDEDNMLGSTGTSFQQVMVKMRCTEARRWPINVEWRGFSGQLIHDVGGHIINDERKETIGVLFPVKINGVVRGGIKAVYEREGKERAYDNMKGPWTSKYGLFPYMYSAKMIRQQRLRFVFLVEGPRDALRLCSLGLPALAVLGATSMSDIKALLVMNLGVTHVYVISDNDAGGTVMWKTIKTYLRPMNSVKLARLKLPCKKDENGDLIKMDPGNMPMKIVHDIVDVLKENHDFKTTLKRKRKNAKK